MTYLLALFLPPLAILFTGRFFLAVFSLPIWLLSILFSGGLTHVMFVALAWVLIYDARTVGASS